MQTVLYVLADVIRVLAIYVQFVVPASAAAMLEQLAVADDSRSFADIGENLVPGTALPKPSPVFPRFVDDQDS